MHPAGPGLWSPGTALPRTPLPSRRPHSGPLCFLLCEPPGRQALLVPQFRGHPKIGFSQQPRLCRDRTSGSWTGLRSRCHSHPARPPARPPQPCRLLRVQTAPPFPQAPGTPGWAPREAAPDPPRGQGPGQAATRRSRPSRRPTAPVLPRGQWRPLIWPGWPGLQGPWALRSHGNKCHRSRPHH